MFPELRPYLDDAFEQASEGAHYVVTRYRTANANLRTQLLRIIRRAGVGTWERVFHNLRASRQTELEDSFPSHVLANWLGASPTIARKHSRRPPPAGLKNRSKMRCSSPPQGLARRSKKRRNPLRVATLCVILRLLAT